MSSDGSTFTRVSSAVARKPVTVTSSYKSAKGHGSVVPGASHLSGNTLSGMNARSIQQSRAYNPTRFYGDSSIQNGVKTFSGVQRATQSHTPASGGLNARAIQLNRTYNPAHFYSDSNIQNATKSSTVVQTSIPMGKPGDKYEQEADAAADKVMQMPESHAAPKPSGGEDPDATQVSRSSLSQVISKVQRKEDVESPPMPVQRADEEGVNAKCDGCANEEKSPALQQYSIQATESGPDRNKDPIQTKSMLFRKEDEPATAAVATFVSPADHSGTHNKDPVQKSDKEEAQSQPIVSRSEEEAAPKAQTAFVSRMNASAAQDQEPVQKADAEEAQSQPIVSRSEEEAAPKAQTAFVSRMNAIEAQDQEPVQKADAEEAQSQPIVSRSEEEAAPKAQAAFVSRMNTSAAQDQEPVQKADAEEAQQSTEEPVQKACAGCEGEKEIQKANDPSCQPKCVKCGEEEAAAKEEEKISKSAASPSASNSVPSHVETGIKSSKGSGDPLPGAVRDQMESGFDADFSNVRVHTDGAADRMNKDIGAQAFAHGSDIYFSSGKFDTSSSAGKHLLAHELTHTIQQGGAARGKPQRDHPIRKKEDQKKDADQVSLSSSRPSVQRLFGLFDGEDPCAEKKEEKQEEPEKDDETKEIEAGCQQRNPPAEEAPEGTKEPDQDKAPAPTEAKEGASTAERQANAPPPEAEEPKSEKNPGEKVVDEAKGPCHEEMPPVQKGPGALNGIVAGGDKGKKGTAETGKGAASGKNAGKDSQWLKSAANAKKSAQVKPAGMGEMASPDLMIERNLAVAEMGMAKGKLGGTRKEVNQFNAGEVHYKEAAKGNKAEEENESAGNATATSTAGSAKARINEMIEEGEAASASVHDSARQKKAAIKSLVRQRKANASALFLQLNAQATAKAMGSVALITVTHLLKTLEIRLKAMNSRLQITQARTKASSDLREKGRAALTALDIQYAGAATKLKGIGVAKGKVAKSIAEGRASAYRMGEGASPEQKSRVVNKKKDGFWDGYLTYNRYMARADAAAETGKQFAEGFETEARKKADAIGCGKSKDIQLIEAAIVQGEVNLQCLFDKSMKGVDQQEKAAIATADSSKKEAVGTITDSLKATQTQLKQKTDSQLQFLGDYGIRQEMAIDRDANRSIAALLKQTAEGAGNLLTLLKEYRSSVNGARAPPAKRGATEASKLLSAIEKQVGSVGLAIKSAKNGLIQSTVAAEQSAFNTINDFSTTSLAEMRKLAAEFILTTDQIREGTISGLGTIVTSFTKSQTTGVADAKKGFDSVLKGVDGFLLKISSNSQKLFDEGAKALEEKFQQKIDRELKMQICVEAEKAAAQVEPWWKSVLKVLLIILVVVVVVLVIGPAIIAAAGAAASALAGTLGLSAAVAATISTTVTTLLTWAVQGAAFSVLFQTAMNLAQGVDVFTGIGDAIIVGLIMGPLGGIGGRLAGALLKGTGILSILGRFGIRTVFLGGGLILSDVALGREFDLKTFLKNLSIATLISLALQAVFKIRAAWKSRGGQNLPARTSGNQGGGNGKGPLHADAIFDPKTNTWLLRNPATGKYDWKMNANGDVYQYNAATGQDVWIGNVRTGPATGSGGLVPRGSNVPATGGASNNSNLPIPPRPQLPVPATPQLPAGNQNVFPWPNGVVPQTWRAHEVSVFQNIQAQFPGQVIGREVYLLGTLSNGQVVRIRIDVLRFDGTTLHLVDAKYSIHFVNQASGTLNSVNLNSLLTTNQSIIYPGIANGSITSLTPFGSSAASLGFLPGVALPVSPVVHIHLNSSQGIYSRPFP